MYYLGLPLPYIDPQIKNQVFKEKELKGKEREEQEEQEEQEKVKQAQREQEQEAQPAQTSTKKRKPNVEMDIDPVLFIVLIFVSSPSYTLPLLGMKASLTGRAGGTLTAPPIQLSLQRPHNDRVYALWIPLGPRKPVEVADRVGTLATIAATLAQCNRPSCKPKLAHSHHRSTSHHHFISLGDAGTHPPPKRTRQDSCFELLFYNGRACV
ncbi:hypothetical protein BT96DRAFT_1050799 [Gymnopus androsaceus JB14]|uniref:Uncharacterized protein n=1 Tax=Gymnopus androsaceus JB14 TaxID=1447944 RepID=A0A6A4GAV9_9AGAR|nr:hypothetical protein BT96DRAFT_1050799 [Gymnopus androsaceus JB14]